MMYVNDLINRATSSAKVAYCDVIIRPCEMTTSDPMIELHCRPGRMDGVSYGASRVLTHWHQLSHLNMQFQEPRYRGL